MKMKLIMFLFVTVLWVCFSFGGLSQTVRNDSILNPSLKKEALGKGCDNLLHFEFFGRAFFWSVNYEKTIFQKERVRIYGGAGFGLYGDGGGAFSRVPVGVGMEYGNRASIDLGFGISPYFRYATVDEEMRGLVDMRRFRLSLTPHVGMRFRPRQGRVVFGFRFIPIIYTDDWQALPWGGALIGYYLTRK